MAEFTDEQTKKLNAFKDSLDELQRKISTLRARAGVSYTDEKQTGMPTKGDAASETVEALYTKLLASYDQCMKDRNLETFKSSTKNALEAPELEILSTHRSPLHHLLINIISGLNALFKTLGATKDLITAPTKPTDSARILTDLDRKLYEVSTGPITSQYRAAVQAERPREKSAEPLRNVLICSDFDGTATLAAGGNLVHTEHYRSLFQNYDPRWFSEPVPEGMTRKAMMPAYNNSEIKIRDDVQQILEARFGKYLDPVDACYTKEHSDMLMTKDAIAFYRAALESDDSEIIIVSKNREDYIKALFKYHGFTDDDMKRIKIKPQDKPTKAETLVAAANGTDGSRPIPVAETTRVYVFDDSKTDYDSMLSAFQSTGVAIQGQHAAPGTFEWGKYQADVKKYLEAGAASVATDAPANSSPRF